MEKKTMKKLRRESDRLKEDVLVNEFLLEMDALLHKYPQDPNQVDLSEEKLEELIVDLDKNWMSFKRRWKQRLDIDKVIASGKVQKDDKGVRHLIIRSQASEDPLIDLVVKKEDPAAA
jgi:hypothetical protein